MDISLIKRNSFKAWLLASRPKTLTGASVPVAIGIAMAYVDNPLSFLPIPAVLCLLFAFVMQIDANFINDLFDYVKGTDGEMRLGPKRACAEGWVTLDAMKKAIVITTTLACFVGLPLVYWGGLEMILIGLLCVIFCFLYTTHLSYLGLGDVLVVVFFGIVPVCITYYIQLHFFTFSLFAISLACGLIIDTLLVVNNYRDRETDKVAGKCTLITRIGERNSRILYFSLGILGVTIGFVNVFTGHVWAFLFPCIYLVPHYQTYRKMVKINKGHELNHILDMTARNIFIYGLLSVAGLLIK
jgi:1,4-dihydroxy-2-naphthoate polyprenyltransferase